MLPFNLQKARLAALLCVASFSAAAHEPGGPEDPADADGGISHVVVPPTIKSTVEATWPTGVPPTDAHVHLELQVDAMGRVVDVHVLESGGEAFDAPAVEAVRQFVFSPATEDGVPVRSFVTYTYVFRATQAPDAGVQAAAPSSTIVVGQRPITASSSFSVRERDFALRPITSVQDILRITPGLVMVQHSGGGKANQYFLRGFDADHGTDVALSIDGIPINMVSHGHGQGYADTNFIIPEAIERVEINKGTSFVNQGISRRRVR